MTEEQKQLLRAQLIEEREKITASLRSLREVRGDVDVTTKDAGDRSELEVDRALEHRINLDDSHLIQKIDFALERLEEGTYGQCEICGETIPLERLLAKPSVSRCRTCQQAKEDHSHVEASH